MYDIRYTVAAISVYTSGFCICPQVRGLLSVVVIAVSVFIFSVVCFFVFLFDTVFLFGFVTRLYHITSNRKTNESIVVATLLINQLQAAFVTTESVKASVSHMVIQSVSQSVNHLDSETVK